VDLDLSKVAALSFDCYGTLIDWESGIVAALQPWLARNRLDLDREDLLALFGSNETVVEAERPSDRYPEILAETLRRITADLGVDSTEAECAAFGASVPNWPAFPDSAAALARLKRRFKLIILSNVDRASFAESNTQLGVPFDLVITAEDVGAYKPDQRNFDRLFAELPSIGVERSGLVHVAESLFHDHGPAQANELPSVWIHRRYGKEGSGATHPPAGVREPEWRFTSMAEFASAALA
jgi:2-haloacid dehalogenase